WNLQNSFYSLIARGFDLPEFNTAGGRQGLDLPNEALWTEFVIALLQVELNDGAPLEDFPGRLREACGALPAPGHVMLDDAMLACLRARIAKLLDCWRSIPCGQNLELSFSVSQSTTPVRRTKPR